MGRPLYSSQIFITTTEHTTSTGPDASSDEADHGTQSSTTPTAGRTPIAQELSRYQVSLDSLAFSQASLRRTSAILEDTLDRLRILRDTILNMRAPSSPTQSHIPLSSSSNMRPNHDAIVLTEPSITADRPTPPSSDRVPPRVASIRTGPLWLRDEEQQSRGRPRTEEILRALREMRENSRQRTEQVRTDTTEFVDMIAMRQHHERRARAAAAAPGEASTTLGRRVAARAAAGPGARDEGRGRDEDVTARLMELATNLERDIQLIAGRRESILRSRRWMTGTQSTAATNSFAGTAGPTSSADAADSTMIQIPPLFSSSALTQDRLVSPLPGPVEQPWGPPARRMSTSAVTSAPALPRPPRQDADASTQTPTRTRFDEIMARANYQVARSELLLSPPHAPAEQPSRSSDYDPFSWLVPPERRAEAHRVGVDTARERLRESERDRERDRERAARMIGQEAARGWAASATATTEAGRRVAEVIAQSRTAIPAESDNLRRDASSTRRRGWARLDADGDEIPTEEEEEYERAREQMRSRAIALSSGQPRRLDRHLEELVLPPPSTSARSLQPTTQPPLWSPTEPSVRVQLGRSPAASARDASGARSSTPGAREVEEFRPRTWGSAVPFIPSPLPLSHVELRATGIVLDKRYVDASVRVVSKARTYVAGR